MDLPKVPIQLSCFFFIATVQAYTVFTPKCSIPTAEANYVSAPNSRGTLDILLKSIFTIFACTWTIHHPNVPRQYHGCFGQNPKSKLRGCFNLGLLSWRLKGFLKSTGRMILTIFAPEVIIAVAYNDRLAAREDHKLLETLAKKGDLVDWSLDHTYYANMGGFVIKKTNAEAEIGDGYNLHHLSGRDLYILRKKRCIGTLPNITQRELKDRVKSDSLIKAISITQIIWSTARILDRTVYGLAICALELTVLAFALCAIAIYWLYWDKPKSIGGRITVDELATEKGISKAYAYSTRHIFSLKRTQASFSKSETQVQYREAVDGAPLRIDTIREGKEFDNKTFWALLVGVVLFGGIHIGGWRVEFPSETHQMLWRVATMYSVGCVFIALVAVLLRKIGEKSNGGFLLGTLPRYCSRFLHVVGLLLYVVARLVILFEMFWTLLFLPPGAYVSSRTFYN
ncbi:hypothetical protein LI328DRAFT_169330 [Trichoderma asperelloides]|nr:hypothetical protein LI328DRAFT_169330 [Trichoderma asperelloides]